MSKAKLPVAAGAGDADLRKIVSPDPAIPNPSSVDPVLTPALGKPAAMFPLWSDEAVGPSPFFASLVSTLFSDIYVVL